MDRHHQIATVPTAKCLFGATPCAAFPSLLQTNMKTVVTIIPNTPTSLDDALQPHQLPRKVSKNQVTQTSALHPLINDLSFFPTVSDLPKIYESSLVAPIVEFFRGWPWSKKQPATNQPPKNTEDWVIVPPHKSLLKWKCVSFSLCP